MVHRQLKVIHEGGMTRSGEPTVKVRRNTLLLIAALVWSAAGFNILRIGLLAYPLPTARLSTICCLRWYLPFSGLHFRAAGEQAHSPDQRL